MYEKTSLMKFLIINKGIVVSFIIIFLINLFSLEKSFCQNKSASICSKYGYICLPESFKSYCKSSTIDSISKNILQVEELINRGKSNQDDWIVYSDRSDNVLYSNPNSSVPSGEKLDFMEGVSVKEVKGNWLHVYSAIYDNKTGKSGLEYNKERGWIKANFVLLNGFSLLNEKSTPKKAMILISLGNLSPNIVNSNILNFQFYNKPSATTSFANGLFAKKFDIYYILKETDGAILLSRSDKLDDEGDLLKKIVPGWMPKSNVTFWDHRICLEPSSIPSTISDYSIKDLPIFHTASALEDFVTTQLYNKNYVFKKDVVRKTRPNPYEMRMPIIDNIDAIKKEVVTITRIGDGPAPTPDDLAKLDQKIQQTQHKIENVNVLFVIDATTSMKNYFEPVANSISKIIENNELKKSNNVLKFGLVIYRDYADGVASYEIEPLTTDDDKILKKLKATLCYSNDHDLAEAQYAGLERGLNEAGFDPNQSNVVVLIGDAGNHQPDPKGKSLSKIVDQLYQKQISFIAFQTYSGKDASFLDFNSDAQDYIRNTAQKYVPNNKSDVQLNELPLKNTYQLQFTGGKGNSNDLLMFGRFTYASGNLPMNTNILEQNIIESINDYTNRVQYIKSILEGMSSRNGVFTPEIIDWLKRMGYTDKDIEILKQAGDITKTGFTSTKFYSYDTECFVPVVFLSKTEKEAVIDIIRKLTNKSGSITDKKKAVQDALTNQCMAMLGLKSEATILDKNMNEIWDIILSIPFTGSYKIRNCKLRDFDKLPDNEFSVFYDKFQIQAKKFYSMSYRESEFELGGQSFYWIPLKDFPGSE